MRNAASPTRWMFLATAPNPDIATKRNDDAVARVRRERLVRTIAHDHSDPFIRVRRSSFPPARSPDVK